MSPWTHTTTLWTSVCNTAEVHIITEDNNDNTARTRVFMCVHAGIHWHTFAYNMNIHWRSRMSVRTYIAVNVCMCGHTHTLTHVNVINVHTHWHSHMSRRTYVVVNVCMRGHARTFTYVNVINVDIHWRSYMSRWTYIAVNVCTCRYTHMSMLSTCTYTDVHICPGGHTLLLMYVRVDIHICQCYQRVHTLTFTCVKVHLRNY